MSVVDYCAVQKIYLHYFALVSRQSAALSFTTQHATPLVFGEKCRTELFNLQCAGYSVKLKKVLLDVISKLHCFFMHVARVAGNYKVPSDKTLRSPRINHFSRHCVFRGGRQCPLLDLVGCHTLFYNLCFL